MSSITTAIAVVEPDRTVKAPPGVEIGSKVLVVPLPSVIELLQDTARRARFAATRRAMREAVRDYADTVSPSDEDIVSLVRRARHSPRAN